MPNATKMISVIVPCFNQALYMADALNSVLEQTYTNWECIIVNDGSTDNTEALAHEWCQRDARFRYIYQRNSGLSAARNVGIEAAEGIYILPLDGDDILGKNYLGKAIEAFKHDPGLTLVYCKAEYFGAQQGMWELPEFSIDNLARGNMIFCSGVYRKEDFLLTSGYNVNMKYGWEDWDFWISLLKQGGRVYQIPEVCFYYRIKDASMVSNVQYGNTKGQKMRMQLFLNHEDFFDRYYKSPLDFIPEYQHLQKWANQLASDNKFLKGLMKLKPESYLQLLKRL